MDGKMKELIAGTAEYDQEWAAVVDYFRQRGPEVLVTKVSQLHEPMVILASVAGDQDMQMIAELLRLAGALVCLQVIERLEGEQQCQT